MRARLADIIRASGDEPTPSALKTLKRRIQRREKDLGIVLIESTNGGPYEVIDVQALRLHLPDIKVTTQDDGPLAETLRVLGAKVDQLQAQLYEREDEITRLEQSLVELQKRDEALFSMLQRTPPAS